MPDLFPIGVPEMITELERELRMRRTVYGRQVAERKMKQEIADRRIRIIEAVIERLSKDIA